MINVQYFLISLLCVFLLRMIIRKGQEVYYKGVPFVMLCSKSWFQLWWDVKYQVFPQYELPTQEYLSKEHLEKTKECVEEYQLIMADVYVTNNYKNCKVTFVDLELEDIVATLEMIYELEQEVYKTQDLKGEYYDSNL